MNLRNAIDRRIASALAQAGATDADALTAPSSRPEFGDYQANGCMAAAKKLKTNPRELAGKVVDALDLADLAESVDIAGPGFLNVKLSDAFLADQLAAMAADDLLGCDAPEAGTVVVDYSGPNLAKEMHVGHLRSTIIGDALARVLGFLGQDVVRQNHVGDWGTQFGMLTALLWDRYRSKLHETYEAGLRDAAFMEATADLDIADLEEFYREAKRLFDEDPKFQERARNWVVQLQQGTEGQQRLMWRKYVQLSMHHCEAVYERLGVLLKPADVRGESAYNDDLPNVVADLDAAGLLAESEGAKGVFLDEFTNKDNEPAFVIVVKSDGGYLYATTDLAAIRYRAGVLKAGRALYVTDSRQGEHFARIFCVSAKAGFHDPAKTSLEHVPFGMMMGADRRPFKTRTGGTVKLMDLLDEAQTRAEALLRERRQADLDAEREPALTDEEIPAVAKVVGIGALKYADLSQNRTSDYVFSWEKMLSLEGNTAPYMQYAYARVRSIFRKGAEAQRAVEDGSSASTAPILLDAPQERALALKLLQFAETIDAVAASVSPTCCAAISSNSPARS